MIRSRVTRIIIERFHLFVKIKYNVWELSFVLSMENVRKEVMMVEVDPNICIIDLLFYK